MKEVLSHYAQFQSWIPFFNQTLDKNKKPLPEFYSTTPSDSFPTQVAKDLYLREGFTDSIYKRIDDSNLIKRQEVSVQRPAVLLF